MKKGGITDDPAESTLQFTDIELYFFCDQVDDIQKIIVYFYIFQLGFFSKDRYSCFIVRRFDIRYDVPLETRAQPVVQFPQLAGMTVAGDDDLLSLIV